MFWVRPASRERRLVGLFFQGQKLLLMFKQNEIKDIKNAIRNNNLKLLLRKIKGHGLGTATAFYKQFNLKVRFLKRNKILWKLDEFDASLVQQTEAEAVIFEAIQR